MALNKQKLILLIESVDDQGQYDSDMIQDFFVELITEFGCVLAPEWLGQYFLVNGIELSTEKLNLMHSLLKTQLENVNDAPSVIQYQKILALYQHEPQIYAAQINLLSLAKNQRELYGRQFNMSTRASRQTPVGEVHLTTRYSFFQNILRKRNSSPDQGTIHLKPFLIEKLEAERVSAQNINKYLDIAMAERANDRNVQASRNASGNRSNGTSQRVRNSARKAAQAAAPRQDAASAVLSQTKSCQGKSHYYIDVYQGKSEYFLSQIAHLESLVERCDQSSGDRNSQQDELGHARKIVLQNLRNLFQQPSKACWEQMSAALDNQLMAEGLQAESERRRFIVFMSKQYLKSLEEKITGTDSESEVGLILDSSDRWRNVVTNVHPKRKQPDVLVQSTKRTRHAAEAELSDDIASSSASDDYSSAQSDAQQSSLNEISLLAQLSFLSEERGNQLLYGEQYSSSDLYLSGRASFYASCTKLLSMRTVREGSDIELQDAIRNQLIDEGANGFELDQLMFIAIDEYKAHAQKLSAERYRDTLNSRDDAVQTLSTQSQVTAGFNVTTDDLDVVPAAVTQANSADRLLSDLQAALSSPTESNPSVGQFDQANRVNQYSSPSFDQAPVSTNMPSVSRSRQEYAPRFNHAAQSAYAGASASGGHCEESASSSACQGCKSYGYSYRQ